MKSTKLNLPLSILLFLILYSPSYGQLPLISDQQIIFTNSITSISHGNWSDLNIWSTGVVPDGMPDVIINNNHSVYIDIKGDNSAEIVDLCRNLQIKSLAILRMGHDTDNFSKDLRINGSILYSGTISKTGTADGYLNIVFTIKYIDSDATAEYTSQQNWHVIRLADVYLMRAEALVETTKDTGQGNDDINALRSRVGMPDFDGNGLSMTDFRTALLRERSAELSMEGHRFFDLTRLGIHDENCRSSYGNTVGARDPEDYTLPIPLIETSAN